MKKLSSATKARARACWKGVAVQKVTNWCAVRSAAVRAGGAQVWPTFQPVKLKVLPDEEMITVRSRMPGSAARGTCVPS